MGAAFSAAQTNPGAKSRQGSSNELALPCRPRDGVRLGVRRILYVKTTLGNGYLGSRIDEERSEMRYLV
jgi:hypothetical protein